jgi:hypothetical protein
MERHATANTAGNSLTLKAGGATSGATDKAGGDLYLTSGISTGTGASNIYLQTATAGATGTTDRTPDTKVTILGSGSVGIGASTPDAKLKILGGGIAIGPDQAINDTDGLRNSIQISTDTAYSGSYDDHSGALIFSTMPGGWGTSQLHFRHSTDWATYGTTDDMVIGNNVGIGTASPVYKLHVNGSFAAQYKNFEIPHPLDPENKLLVHSSIEGPEHAVYYRGKAQLVNGVAEIKLPDYFEALTRKDNRTVQLTSTNGYSPLYVAEDVKDGRFLVRTTKDGNSSQRFYWEVKAVRLDVPELAAEQERPKQ